MAGRKPRCGHAPALNVPAQIGPVDTCATAPDVT
jgi:hypothetical protein